MLEQSNLNIHPIPPFQGSKRKPKLDQINEDPKENITGTAMKRQLEQEMAIDINPKVSANPEDDMIVKESSEEVEVRTNRRKKMIAGGIGIFLILAIIVTVSVMLAIYLTQREERVKVRVSMKKRNQLSVTKDTKISSETLALSDADMFAEGEELQIFVNEVESTSSEQDGGRLLQQTTSSSAVIEIHDPYTDITVSVNSDKFQAEVGVALNSVLAYVLNNQPPADTPEPTPSLKVDGEEVLMAAGEDEIPLDRVITYYTVNEKLETAISEVLREAGATDLRTSLERSFDGSITSGGLMEIIPQNGLQSNDPEFAEQDGALYLKSPRLVKPSTNVTLNDIFNETQIAMVAARVVRDVVIRLKEVVKKHLALIEKEAGVNLQSVDPTNGETSLYLDEPSDVLKGCSQLSSGDLRCTENILQSGLFELSDSKATEIPQLLVKLTL